MKSWKKKAARHWGKLIQYVRRYGFYPGDDNANDAAKNKKRFVKSKGRSFYKDVEYEIKIDDGTNGQSGT